MLPPWTGPPTICRCSFPRARQLVRRAGGSSGGAIGFRQGEVRQCADAAPMLKFAVAAGSLKGGQCQDSLRRPTHPLMLAPRRDRPVVEFLHPCAGNPEPRSTALRIVGDVGTPLLQVRDQFLNPSPVAHPRPNALEKFDRLIDLAFPKLLEQLLRQRPAPFLGTARQTDGLITSLLKMPPTQDHGLGADSQPLEPCPDPTTTVTQDQQSSRALEHSQLQQQR